VADNLAEAFAARYGAAPDGVWSAPGRVNLIGEHTDYNAGFCLPIALPHRTFAAARRRDDGVVSVAGLQADQTWTGTLADVGPGRPRGWIGYPLGVLWALNGQGHHVGGLDLLVDGRVPLGSGLSSSAALECAVAVAAADLSETAGPSVDDLVTAAITAENVVVGASTGGLDQTAALRCTAGHALLLDCRDFGTTQIPWRIADDGWRVLVVDTRAPHALADGQYAARRADCEEAAARRGLSSLRDLSPEGLEAALEALPTDRLRGRVRHVVSETARAEIAAAALAAGDVTAFGSAWWASHASLRDDYEVSAPGLDTVVEVARSHGAAGARMTGGGFGGSAIALVRDGEESALADAVAAAFAEQGWAAPQFLIAVPSEPAGRDR
jgi:galactokinase